MRKFAWLVQSLLLLIIFILLLFSPEAAFSGAMRGLKLWAMTLLPSLLPFLILSELLLSSNIVYQLGRLLEPVMRPLFHLPGVCAFALALGFTSGFPMGASASASLARENLCTKKEAARLAAFTNNSSPLFILSAVAVGMLSRADVGIILLIAHYGANLILGVLLGFLANKDISARRLSLPPSVEPSSIWQSLTKAVKHGTAAIINIGGFVTLFSVIVALGEKIGLFALTNQFFAFLLRVLGLAAEGQSALSYGLFEMTLGVNEMSSAAAPFLLKLAIISFIMGWGGLSVQAQVCAILAEEGISTKYFLLLRPLQAILSSLLVIVLFHFFASKSVTVGSFFNAYISSSPLVSSVFITLLPLFILLGSIVFIFIFRLGYKLLWK